MATEYDKQNVGWSAAYFSMGADLKLVLLFLLFNAAFMYLPGINVPIVRTVSGLVMALFVPGYALTALIFPGKPDISGIERLALTIGLSIAVVPLIALGLNYTPWGVRLDPIIACLMIFTIVCVLLANKRRQSLPAEKRFSVDFIGFFNYLKAGAFGGESNLDKALTAFLILALLIAFTGVVYVAMTPGHGDMYTEFYILGPEGKADHYPTELALGNVTPVIVGVVNHESRNVTYDLVVLLNNSSRTSTLYTEQLTLGDNQTWKKPISLTPDQVGDRMRMEFLLYKDGNMTAPYSNCLLWINVTAVRPQGNIL